MKTKLALSILTFISLNVFSQTKKTITIRPKTTSMGIIKGANSIYSLQTSTNGVLIGTQDSKVGRGYLEYDLTGKIPTGAKIDSAEIVLIGKLAPSGNTSNFGGKLRIERSNLTLTGANSSTWDALNTTFNSNDGGLNGVELQFNNTSDIKVASGIPIMSAVAQPINNKATFVIKHISETSNYIYLDPLPSNAFILNIVYSTKGQSSGDNGSSNLVSDEKVIVLGDKVTYATMLLRSIGYINKGWSFPSDIFDALNHYISSYSNISYDNVVLKLKDSFKGIAKTQVKHTQKSNTQDEILTIPIIAIGDITPKSSNSGSVIGANSNISYTIPGLENIPGYTIQWTALENITLVSGQGTANPIFKTSGNGYASVKAIITYKGIKYETPTSKIWIGKPAVPIFKTNSFKIKDKLNSVDVSIINYSINDKVTWSISGGTFDYTSTSYASAYVSGSGLSLNITATVINAYGSASSSVSFPKYLIDGPTKPINGGGSNTAERSVSANTQEESNFEFLKIYNLSGVLVYSDNNVNRNFDIRSTSLNNGIYIIEKYDGKNKSSQKVNLKR